jgi:HSP20 family protein
MALAASGAAPPPRGCAVFPHPRPARWRSRGRRRLDRQQVCRSGLGKRLPVRPVDDDAARWDPLAELDRLSHQVRTYLDRWAPGGAFIPLAEVEETDDAYIVEIELPGVKREDVNLELSGSRLTVAGERKERERVGILRRRTRTVGRFHYEVVLPGAIDDGTVEASMSEGVLTVRAPKPARDRPRRIPIS